MFHNKRERFNDTFSLDDLLIVFKIFKIKIVRSFIIHTPIDGHFHLNYTLKGSCVQCARLYYYTYLRFSLSIITSYMVVGLYILSPVAEWRYWCNPWRFISSIKREIKYTLFFIVLFISYNTNIMWYCKWTIMKMKIKI